MKADIDIARTIDRLLSASDNNINKSPSALELALQRSNNQFSRDSLVREIVHVPAKICDWCGAKRKTGNLFRYVHVTALGQRNLHKGLFCKVSCHDSFHNLTRASVTSLELALQKHHKPTGKHRIKTHPTTPTKHKHKARVEHQVSKLDAETKRKYHALSDKSKQFLHAGHHLPHSKFRHGAAQAIHHISPETMAEHFPRAAKLLHRIGHPIVGLPHSYYREFIGAPEEFKHGVHGISEALHNRHEFLHHPIKALKKLGMHHIGGITAIGSTLAGLAFEAPELIESHGESFLTHPWSSGAMIGGGIALGALKHHIVESGIKSLYHAGKEIYTGHPAEEHEHEHKHHEKSNLLGIAAATPKLTPQEHKILADFRTQLANQMESSDIPLEVWINSLYQAEQIAKLHKGK
jgi:hypothetical protein